MIDCVVDFDVDDRREHLVRLLRRLAPILQHGRERPWGLDLRKCQYLGPFATAVISALWKQGEADGVPRGIGAPVGPTELLGYWRFAGLEQLFVNGRDPDPGHPKSETVPIRFVKESMFNDPDPLVTLVRRHHAMGAEAEDRIRTCINETLQNVQDHAATTLGGVYTGRFMGGRAEVRVAVVDTGAGIARTLSARYPHLRSDDAALRAVLEGQHSARSTKRNMGVGITTMARLVSNCGGHFLLVSGSAVREVEPGGGASGRDVLEVPFPGTGVFFTFPELTADDDDRDGDHE